MPKPERSLKKPAEQAQPVCTTEMAQAVPVTCSHYSSAWDARPTKPISGTWERFVEGLRQGVQRTVPAPQDSSEEAWQDAKAQLPGFVCAAFDGRRRNVNAGHHTAIVIDVDDVSDDAALTARLQRWRCVAYESPSSFCRGNGLRLRVVVALTEPVPPHAVKAARSAFARELGLDPAACGVDKANAISQIMFIGRVDGTPERRLWSYDGAAWTPPPGEAPPAREAHSSDAAAPQWSADRIPDLSAVAKSVGELDEYGMRRGGRHVSRALGGYLARRGYHPDAIEQAVREQIPSDQPEVRAEQARQCAEQVFDGDPNGAGYTALESHFGEAVMAELDDATADPWIKMMIAKWPPPRASNDIRPLKDATWPPPGPALQITSAADIAAPLPPVDWLCERLGLAIGGRPNLFAAPAGGGKTTSAQALALAVASGGVLFGDGEFACRKGSVLHLDIDQGSAATKRRYQRLAAGLGLDLRTLPLACAFQPLALAKRDQIDQDALALLARTVRGYDLVIVDSLRALAPSLDEQSSEFGSVLHALQHITYHLGTTWLVIHHSGKGEGTAVRGTSAIRDRAGCIWVLDEGGRWRHDKVSELSESRMPPFATLCTSSSQGGLEGSLTLSTVAGAKSPGEPTAEEKRTVAEFVKDHPDGVSRAATEMAVRGRIARDRVRGVIETLLSDQVLAPHGTGKLSRLVPGPNISEALA